MERKLVEINENGNVFIPNNVQMRDFEIAELFGAMILYIGISGSCSLIEI
jgi:hypothetical protein